MYPREHLMITVLLDNHSILHFNYKIAGINENIPENLVPSGSGLINPKGNQSVKIPFSPTSSVHDTCHFWIQLFPTDAIDKSVHIFLWLSLFHDTMGRKSSCLARIAPEGRALPSSAWIVTGRVSHLTFKIDSNIYTLDLHKKKKKYIIYIKEIDNEASALLLTSIPNISNSNESQACDLIYENERKKHRLGHKKYDKNSLTRFDLPSWSDCSGLKLNDKNWVFCPSPIWSYDGSWNLATSDSSSDGWLYSSKWSGPWKSSPSFSSTVRQRLWYRVRSIRHHDISNIPKRNEALIESQSIKNIDANILSEFIKKFETNPIFPKNLHFFSSYIFLAEVLRDKSDEYISTSCTNLLFGPRWTR